MQVHFENQSVELNELKRRLFYFGQDTIARFYAPSGLAWFYSSLEYNISRFGRIVHEINDQNPNVEEIVFSANLKGLVDYLRNLRTNLMQLKKMPSVQRQEAEMRIILDLTNQLEEIVAGHVDYDDSDCPACHNKRDEATWQSWQQKKSLNVWLNIISRVYWKRSRNGILSPYI
ncbi:MAG: hypothetical protein AABX29_03625 [Nanoarchaeota archaeon]